MPFVDVALGTHKIISGDRRGEVSFNRNNGFNKTYSIFLLGSGIPVCPCFTLETVFVQLRPRFLRLFRGHRAESLLCAIFAFVGGSNIRQTVSPLFSKCFLLISSSRTHFPWGDLSEAPFAARCQQPLKKCATVTGQVTVKFLSCILTFVGKK